MVTSTHDERTAPRGYGRSLDLRAGAGASNGGLGSPSGTRRELTGPFARIAPTGKTSWGTALPSPSRSDVTT